MAEESRGEPNEAAEGSHQGEPGRPSRREGGAGKQELKYALLSFFVVVVVVIVGRAALRGRSLCHGSDLAQRAEQGNAGRRAYALFSLNS